MLGDSFQATSQQIVDVLLGGAAITGIILMALGVAEKVKHLRTKAPPLPDEDFVTKGQFADFKASVTGKIDTLDAKVEKLDGFTRHELDMMKRDLFERMQKMDEYQHQANHRIADTLNALMLKVNTLATIEQIRHPSTPVSQEPKE